jgi:hypothetical protein
MTDGNGSQVLASNDDNGFKLFATSTKNSLLQYWSTSMKWKDSLEGSIELLITDQADTNAIATLSSSKAYTTWIICSFFKRDVDLTLG